MRLLGVNIPDNKKLEYALPLLFGVGLSRARKILTDAKVPFNKKGSELTTEEEARIKKIVESLNIEGNLKREIASNIKRLKDIKAYRGTRHLRRLPARGQRTKTNSRTIRGNVRKTMGSGRRTLEKT
jgi:small subunit ribosomal protein S13